jgi:hypothetical protein
MLEEMPRELYITLTESAHYPDAIFLACGGSTYLLLCGPPGGVTTYLSTSCDTYMALLHIGAEWQNGGMAEWRNGVMAEWRNGGMAEWRNGGMTEWRNGRMAKWWDGEMVEWWNGGMAEWRNGGMAEWHNVRYKIVRYQDTESTQMPPWGSPSWLVYCNNL